MSKDLSRGAFLPLLTQVRCLLGERDKLGFQAKPKGRAESHLQLLCNFLFFDREFLGYRGSSALLDLIL